MHLLDRAVGTHDEPVSFDQLTDGRIGVHISQVVRSLDGSIVSQGDVLHSHRIEGIHISRMDIEADLNQDKIAEWCLYFESSQ